MLQDFIKNPPVLFGLHYLIDKIITYSNEVSITVNVLRR